MSTFLKIVVEQKPSFENRQLAVTPRGIVALDWGYSMLEKAWIDNVEDDLIIVIVI